MKNIKSNLVLALGVSLALLNTGCDNTESQVEASSTEAIETTINKEQAQNILSAYL